MEYGGDGGDAGTGNPGANRFPCGTDFLTLNPTAARSCGASGIQCFPLVAQRSEHRFQVNP